MSCNFPDRAARLDAIVRSCQRSADFPLVKAVRVPEALSARLRGAVAAYLWQTLTVAHANETFELAPDILVRHADRALALPNRTPNGVLLPRVETCLAFNLVHQAMVSIFEALKLIDPFSRFQLPFNVRIVSGELDASVEQRPYSSSKVHTDVWNGEPQSSILFNIPVLGDAAVGIRFFEPMRFPADLIGPLDDYEKGRAVLEGMRAYPLVVEMGEMYISDALSLHQTIKSGTGVRVSLDFRCIARDLLPGENADTSKSKAVYVEASEWRAAGRTKVLGSGLPIDAFQRQQRGESIEAYSLAIRRVD